MVNQELKFALQDAASWVPLASPIMDVESIAEADAVAGTYVDGGKTVPFLIFLFRLLVLVLLSLFDFETKFLPVNK